MSDEIKNSENKSIMRNSKAVILDKSYVCSSSNGSYNVSSFSKHNKNRA